MKKNLPTPLNKNSLSLARVICFIPGLFLSLVLIAQNVGIGTASPQKKLTINGSILLDQNNTNDGALDSAALLFGTQGGVGIASKKTSGGLDNGLSLFTSSVKRINITAAGLVGIGTETPEAKLHVSGNLKTISEIWSLTNGRFDGRLSVGGSGLPEYKFYVHNGNSFFQGGAYFTGNITTNTSIWSAGTIQGSTLLANGATINNNISVGGNATVGGDLNVSTDGIIDGNFRVNGRVGINGATNANYGLIVNSANSYFQGNTTTSGSATVQGNTTIQGNTNLQGNVTIQGKGHVRSNGTSSLRVGFSSYTTNAVYDGHDEKAFTVSIPDFDGGADNVRVTIAQFEPEAGTETSHFKWYVYDVDSVNDTAKIRVINDSAFIHVLHGTFYLLAVAKD